MRFLQYLNEEYLARDGTYEIFINPTKKEILSIKDAYLRCIADFKKKNLYVFSHNLYHDKALCLLSKKHGLMSWGDWKDLKSKTNNYYAFFTAKLYPEGKLKFYRSDTGSAWGIGIVSELKWTKMSDAWLNTWFSPGFIKTFMEEIQSPRTWQ